MTNLTGDYTTSDEGEYTEYTVAADSALWIAMEEGDVFQNALIDVTASGATVRFFTYPDPHDPKSPISSCAIRNVGIRGQIPTDSGYVFSTAVTGSAVIENVYLGDGDVGSSPHAGTGAFFGFESHIGQLDLRRIYVAGFTYSAFYMAGRPGARGSGWDGSGTYHWEECYVEANEISAYRINDQTGCSMTECYTALGGTTGRAVWLYDDGTMDITDCQLVGGSNGGIVGTGTAHFSGDVDVAGGVTASYTGSFNSLPSVSVPDDCPTSALEAATGDASTSPRDPGAPGGPGGDLENQILVSGEHRSTTTAAEYTLRTTGPIEPGEYEDPELTDSDIVDHGNWYEVVWTIADWRDSWRFAGELFAVSCEADDVRFTLNGTVIDPDAPEFSQEPPEDDDDTPTLPDDVPERDPDHVATVTVPADTTETVTIDVDTTPP